MKDEVNNLFLVIQRARSSEELASKIQTVLMVEAQKYWKKFLSIIILMLITGGF